MAMHVVQVLHTWVPPAYLEGGGGGGGGHQMYCPLSADSTSWGVGGGGGVLSAFG